MKNFLRKIGIYAIISVILINFNAVAFADDNDSSVGNTAGATLLQGDLQGLTATGFDDVSICFPYPKADDLTKAGLPDPNNPNSQKQLTQAEKDALKEAKQDKISEDYKKLLTDFPGLRYNITSIEEPLGNEFYDPKTEYSKIENNEDFAQFTCFRNVLTYTHVSGGEPKEQKTISNVSGYNINYADSCSQKGQDLENLFLDARDSNAEIKKLAVNYTCTPVQVLLSKGGSATLEAYIASIYRWGAGIAGLIAVLVIVINGITISASGGDSQAIENAKTRIVQSLAGIVILFLSGLILYTINPNFFVR